MNGDIDILHHVGLIVTNMEATVAQYERLGFQFTPISIPKVPLRAGGQPESLGVGNRCAIFENNYLEILSVIDRNRWEALPTEYHGPYALDESLSRYEGLHVMHFGTSDLDLVDARLSGQHIPHSSIAPFKRMVETPEGPKMMEARSLHFPAGSNPEALLQIAQHLTPELVLQPRYMQHGNGAKSVTECLVCTPEPGEVAAKYERYTGHASERQGGQYVVNLGFSRIIVFSPEHLEIIVPGCVVPSLPFLAGFTVDVEDLEETRRYLVEKTIPHQEVGGRLIVGREDACGSAVLFEKKGAARSNS